MAANVARLAILLLAVLLLLDPPAAAGHETEEETEFSYEEGSENGPENWGNLRKEWATCGTGRSQSPVDIERQWVNVAGGLGHLNTHYRPAEAVLKNRGHDIMLRWEEDVGGILINGTEYSLKQLHWHTPSEHTIDGHRYLMEAHMVHESIDKKIAVVGILYTLGRKDSFLAKLESAFREMIDLKEEEVSVGMVDPRKVNGWSTNYAKYYRYMGSLTTPPCTEGVVWTIIKKVRTASIKQVTLLREAVDEGFENNARPTQALNGRNIYYFPRKFSDSYSAY